MSWIVLFAFLYFGVLCVFSESASHPLPAGLRPGGSSSASRLSSPGTRSKHELHDLVRSTLFRIFRIRIWPGRADLPLGRFGGSGQ